MRIPLTRLVAIATACAAVAAGVAATPARAQIGTVNTAAMAAYIQRSLDNKVNGYAFAIAKDGQLSQSGAFGKARNAVDGNLNFTTNTRIEIASATKNITAAAILKLLEANGINVDGSVNGYFPYNWTRGAGWEDVTWRMLLAHRSGLKQQGAALGNPTTWNTLFAGVKYAVSQPITAPASYAYTNMNYASLRILLAKLWKLDDPNNGQPSLNSANSGQIALNYVNKYLLVPAGITGIGCASSASTAFIYDGANSPNPGSNPALSGGNLEACAGHRGLNMSAIDLVRFQAHLRHGNIVSQSVRNLMDNVSNHPFAELGWSNRSNGGSAGSVGAFWHAGAIFLPPREVHTCQAKLPKGIEMAVVQNSPRVAGASPCRVILDAYAAGS